MSRHGNEGVFIPPTEDGQAGLFVYDIDHPFKVGDTVFDVTAEQHGWVDVQGEVIEVDGSNIHVHYLSGNERWKRHINLRLSED